jgi:hypothetical protein
MYSSFRVGLTKPPPQAVWRPNPVSHYANAGYAGRSTTDFLAAEARKIATLPGAAKIQSGLLRAVYDTITPFPDRVWTTYLAIVSDRCVCLLFIIIRLSDRFIWLQLQRASAKLVFKSKRGREEAGLPKTRSSDLLQIRRKARVVRQTQSGSTSFCHPELSRASMVR